MHARPSPASRSAPPMPICNLPGVRSRGPVYLLAPLSGACPVADLGDADLVDRRGSLSPKVEFSVLIAHAVNKRAVTVPVLPPETKLPVLPTSAPTEHRLLAVVPVAGMTGSLPPPGHIGFGAPVVTCCRSRW